jgi:predicted nucleic acid-binding protein
MNSGPCVFLDSSGLLALLNRRDALHDHALRVRDELVSQQAHLVTTDWVLSEFLGAAARLESRVYAARWIVQLQQSRLTTIVEASRQGWLEAFALYRTRPDKAWSLVDCASMLLCRNRTIRQVFTHDHHFEQAGFRALLRQTATAGGPSGG